MVPEEYHDFFVAGAGVAGALIGLLFVAISVKPEDLHHRRDVRQRLRPATAMTALLNALFVCLVSLMPGRTPAFALTALSLVNLFAVVSLISRMATATRGAGKGWLLRALSTMALQLIACLAQLLAALALAGQPSWSGPVGVIAGSVLVMFSSGIDRAWEFIGAQTPGLWVTIFRAVNAHHQSHPDDSSEPGTDQDTVA